MYSRGAAAIAEQLSCSVEEAQKIIDDFYNSFPTVKTWMNESLESLRRDGYITDFYGRRRRLPDIKLQKVVVKYLSKEETFNPIVCCDDRSSLPPADVSRLWIERYNKCFGKKAKEELKAEAAKNNLYFEDNQGFIAQAERQCVNARIQGGAATMTKIAMNKIFRDPELNSYDFKLLINVHDELIGQCKEEYAEQCAARLCEVMRTCISEFCNVPFKCDPAVTVKWYFDEMAHQLQKDYSKLIEAGKTEEDARKELFAENCEFLPEEFDALLAFKD